MTYDIGDFYEKPPRKTMKNCQENPNLNKIRQKYCALYTKIKVCSYS
jgi:hypothetical protein